MGKIEQTLKKIKDDVKPLLDEMYPDLKEGIAFAYQDDFQEWFGMLFDMPKWQMKSGLINIEKLIDSMSERRAIETSVGLEDYERITDFGYISVVDIEGEHHLIDGFHRVLVAKQRDLLQLKGVIWEKKSNNHPNCAKIRKLIINNL
mgnify:CR=1 FL=1